MPYKILKDSLNVAGFTFTTEFHSDAYVWYAPNVTKGYLFAITNATSTPSVGAPVTQKTAELRVLEGVGIPTLQAKPLNAYPNPTANQLSVDCPSDLEQTATIKVYDLTGKAVKTATVSQSGKQSILVGDLPSGMYLVTLQSADKLWRQKVNVIH